MLFLNSRFSVLLVAMISFAALSACGDDDTSKKSTELCCDEPAALIDTPGFSGLVYVDSNEIYWLDRGLLKKTSKHANDPQLVAETSYGSGQLLGDDKFLYAMGTDGAGAAVVTRMKRDGSGQKVLGVGDEGEYLCEAVDDESFIYWSDESGIKSVAKDGNSPYPYPLTSRHGCAKIAIGENYIFFTRSDGIYRMEKIHGDDELPIVKMDISDNPKVSKLLLQGDTLFWAQSSGYGPSEVKRASIHGEDPQTLASGQNNLFDLAVDDTHVYWTTYESRELRRVPINGGSIEDFRVAQAYIPFVYLDKNYVFWSEGDKLMKQLK